MNKAIRNKIKVSIPNIWLDQISKKKPPTKAQYRPNLWFGSSNRLITMTVIKIKFNTNPLNSKKAIKLTWKRVKK